MIKNLEYAFNYISNLSLDEKTHKEMPLEIIRHWKKG